MHIKLLHILIPFVVIPFAVLLPQGERTAAPHPPQIDILPKTMLLHVDSTGFLTATAKVLNRGGEPLVISKITPSCGCATAKVAKNPTIPLDITPLHISINTSTVTDSVMAVEFTIESNSTGSPTVYRVQIHNPNALKKP
ncbi:MAG: DUF1573 domain-containing protein [Candidatus Kapabacteria bacterium]|nr:DUF1573 domain-containing protein [Candidatus Kapabacteria bacterium]